MRAIATRLLGAPTRESLRAAKARLEAEVAAHQATLRELEAARAELERQVEAGVEEIRTLNARFTAGLQHSSVTLIEQDADLRYTWTFNTPFGLRSEHLVGRTETDFMAPESAAAVRALKREVLETGEARQGEFEIGTEGNRGWFLLRAEPTRLLDGRPGLIGSSIEITAQKQQQAHLEVVMRELNHRSKNLLTIVQSIARQTASGLDVPEAFLTRMSERLRALAAAHDVLVQGHWRAADVRAVIEGQIRHQLQAVCDRITLDGEPTELAPETAHYLGLAVHELGANAAKYGALSNEDGRVEVRWAFEPWVDGRRLRLEWREAGGPPVAPPVRRGFGITILEVLAPRALGGTAQLAFGETGLTWTLTAPVPVVADQPRGAIRA
jgi:PAS domain S-box-containing protein